MGRASKRAKTTATSTATPEVVDSGGVSAQTQLFIPFQTGTSLERIPDDVLHEILCYLPALTDRHVSFGGSKVPPTLAVALPCNGMQGVELCGVSIRNHNAAFYRAIGEATKTGVRVLKACPHLLPLIQTVSVVLTRFQSAEIIPAFADCLATLPSLTTIQVIHAHSKMTTAIKNGFKSKQFPSVRRITLPCSAHEIIKSCPNLEEVTCTGGDGSTIIGSLVKGDCRQVRILRGISAPLTRLLKLVPKLKHISVPTGVDMTPLTSFPLLDTIEILLDCDVRQDLLLSEAVVTDVKKASIILQENESQAEKTLIVTKWNDDVSTEFDVDGSKGHVIREVIKL